MSIRNFRFARECKSPEFKATHYRFERSRTLELAQELREFDRTTTTSLSSSIRQSDLEGDNPTETMS